MANQPARGRGLTVNGRTSFLVNGADGRDRVLGSLGRMDGRTLFSVVLFPLDDGVVSIHDQDLTSVERYLQAAGTSTRMTVELREELADTYRHVILGRAIEGRTSPKETVVEWLDESNAIFEHEVFTAEEAAHVFVEYFDNLGVPGHLSKRPL